MESNFFLFLWAGLPRNQGNWGIKGEIKEFYFQSGKIKGKRTVCQKSGKINRF